MRSTRLRPVRRCTSPQKGDTWSTVARRELADMPEADAVSLLQSVNLHVFMRPAAAAGSPREGNPILPSDVIFLEPPQRA